MVIGGAWLKEKEGKKWFSCQISAPFLGVMNFAIFKNDKKEKENQPDYHIVWSMPKKSNDSDQPKTGDNPFLDDDIPF